MKKMMIAALLMTLSVSSFANCTKAYEVKAKARAVTNANWTKAGMIAGGSIGTLASLALFPATGGFSVVAAPFTFILISEATTITPTKENTFYKSLAVIAASKDNIVPKILLDALDKKMSLYSHDQEEQNEIALKAAKIVNDANESKELCEFKNGKPKLLNFRKLVKYVAKRL